MATPGTALSIAIVGAGIAGLGAARTLARRHRVELFERDPRAGGHAHTHEVEDGGRTWTIDTGFLVYNHATYPNFVRLLGELGVTGHASEMSFGVRCRRCRVVYSSRGWRGVFAQRRRMLAPRFLRMLADIPRFNRAARAHLDAGSSALSLGAFLDTMRPRPSDAFVRHYLLPMVGAIWSAPSGALRAFPARSLFRFMRQHGLLALTGAPRWWTITGGSRRYVDAMASPLGESLHLGTGVDAVRRQAGGVLLRVRGTWRRFDRLVLATHADQALRLLLDPSPAEREALTAFRYSRNRTVLHTDVRVLPAERAAWASWNSDVADCRDEEAPVAITYDVSRLQGLGGGTHFCVTLNGDVPDEAVLAEMTYEHPVMDERAARGQRLLAALSGARHTYYAGAHLGAGFHEDGLVSGLAAARAIAGTAS